MGEHRDYYAFRRGAQRPSESIENLRRILAAEYRRLEHMGYFQRHFGKDCVDSGNLPGESCGSDPAAYVQWALGRDLWPFEESIVGLDEDWIFTVLEFLHDHVAKPVRTRPHDWDDCGLHVLSSDEEGGRVDFRNSMNRYLPRYKDGYELQDDGEIWRAAPTGLDTLMPADTGNEAIDSRVRHAIATFRHRNASDEQKRDAIRNLADVLEYLREEGKTGLPTKDEDRLFEIANQYAIRHHNPRQRTSYDAGIWLDWMFYAFLNGVALAGKLSTRQSLDASDTHTVEHLPFE